MKKFIVLTATALLAASMQAATFSWGWSLHAEDGDLNILSGTFQIIGLTSELSLDGGGNVAATSSFADGSTSYTLRFTTSGYYVDSTLTTPVTWSVDGPVNDASMGTLWTTAIADMQTHTGGSGAFDVSTFSNPSNWTPVPEPTSMALFGIGAAALALRRKFRKS